MILFVLILKTKYLPPKYIVFLLVMLLLHVCVAAPLKEEQIGCRVVTHRGDVRLNFDVVHFVCVA